MPTKYKSKYTGVVHNKKEDAIRDNWLYLNNPSFRIGVKQNTVKSNSELNIPFIQSKKVKLSNAGLATGAVVSTNMLDSIAKYADRAGLPIKTALGLTVKESTLGNPTYDASAYNILSKENREYVKRKSRGTGQDINNGRNINARDLINYHKDNDNPYTVLLNTARKSKDYIGTLLKGEKYADKLAETMKGRENTNVLEAGFRSYAEHPERYNPGQPNYQKLVDKRANEVWSSPEVQNWHKGYRRRLESRGKLTK